MTSRNVIPANRTPVAQRRVLPAVTTVDNLLTRLSARSLELKELARQRRASRVVRPQLDLAELRGLSDILTVIRRANQQEYDVVRRRGRPTVITRIVYYTITEGPITAADDMNLATRPFSINFNVTRLRELEFPDILRRVEQAVQEVFTRTVTANDLHPNDLVNITMDRRNNARVQPTTVRDFDSDNWINTNAESLQSWQVNHLGEPLDISVTSVQFPRGGGTKNNTRVVVTARDLFKKGSIVSINNSSKDPNDQTCGACAIVVGIAHQNKTVEAAYYKKIANPNRTNEMMNKAHDIYDTILESKPYDEMCDLVDFVKIEKNLNIQIAIIDHRQNNKRVYLGEPVLYSNNKKRPIIYLLQLENHYSVITSITGYLCVDGYCIECDKGYFNKEHICPNNTINNYDCKCCFTKTGENHYKDRIESKETGKWLQCKDCNRKFPSDECFNLHIDSCCSNLYKCLECNKVIKEGLDPRKSHKCGNHRCLSCKEMVEKDHSCFWQIKKTNIKKKHRYFFYDFEAYTDGPVHVINYAVIQNEAGEEVAFKNINDFCVFVFNSDYKNSTFLAHNSKGYDAIFINNWLLNHSLAPHIIYSGSKIMMLTVSKLNIRFIDSINFIQTSLSSFSKQFGLTETCKGYFPHLFNTAANQKYVGPYPDVSTYSPEAMKCCTSSSKKDDYEVICEKEKKDTCGGCRGRFYRWYAQKVNTESIFNFAFELDAYCSSDVTLLREGIMSFRETFKKETSELCDPLQCCTIASAVQLSYRIELLEEKTIPIIDTGITFKNKQENNAICWLEGLMTESKATANPIFIQHAENGGITLGKTTMTEKTIKGMICGYDAENKTIYFFNTCYNRGCPKCFTDRALKNTNFGNKTVQEINDDFNKFMTFVHANNDFTVKSIWEHEFINNGPESSKSLDPREAFFGGRTNASCLNYTCAENEQIDYFDFTSLYPYVNKYGVYPIDHPLIIRDISDTNIDMYKGLIKCSIIPPTDLFHPVLPITSHGKLIFGLCGKCIHDNTVKHCEHTGVDRQLVGSWSHLELTKALSVGYKITKIHEVHHFHKWSQGLYAPFVNKWLRTKQEASGYPDWCITDVDKQKYIDEYFEKEGIQLRDEMIIKNPGRRSTAKLILNSFWGKLGQRTNMSQDKFCTEPEEFFKILTNTSLKVHDFKPVGNNVAYVNYSYKAEFVKPSHNTNIYHALYTTSQARLKLYDLLEKLGNRVLYYDTDSVIFVRTRGEEIPGVELGDFLGDLTSELGYGDYITRFVSGGPKNYAYTTNQGKTVVKVKGFGLNYETSQKINLDSMLLMIMKAKTNEKMSVAVPVLDFQINKLKATIKTNHNAVKKYEFVYDTRWVDWESLKTFPIGFKEDAVPKSIKPNKTLLKMRKGVSKESDLDKMKRLIKAAMLMSKPIPCAKLPVAQQVLAEIAAKEAEKQAEIKRISDEKEAHLKIIANFRKLDLMRPVNDDSDDDGNEDSDEDEDYKFDASSSGYVLKNEEKYFKKENKIDKKIMTAAIRTVDEDYEPSDDSDDSDSDDSEDEKEKSPVIKKENQVAATTEYKSIDLDSDDDDDDDDSDFEVLEDYYSYADRRTDNTMTHWKPL